MSRPDTEYFITPSEKPRKEIGFLAKEKPAKYGKGSKRKQV
jgi:hypothetical protein